MSLKLSWNETVMEEYATWLSRRPVRLRWVGLIMRRANIDRVRVYGRLRDAALESLVHSLPKFRASQISRC